MNKKKKKRLIITCIKNCGNTHVYMGVCLNCGSEIVGFYAKKSKQPKIYKVILDKMGIFTEIYKKV